MQQRTTFMALVNFQLFHIAQYWHDKLTTVLCFMRLSYNIKTPIHEFDLAAINARLFIPHKNAKLYMKCSQQHRHCTTYHYIGDVM